MLHSGHFYLYNYYHFITSMGPLVFTWLGILAHIQLFAAGPGTDQTWHLKALETLPPWFFLLVSPVHRTVLSL